MAVTKQKLRFGDYDEDGYRYTTIINYTNCVSVSPCGNAEKKCANTVQHRSSRLTEIVMHIKYIKYFPHSKRKSLPNSIGSYC